MKDWEIFLPELLVDCGAYQYIMDPSKTIDEKYKLGKYSLAPNNLVEDIFSLDNRSVPIDPSLCIKSKLDGTNTPSQDGTDEHRVFKLDQSTLGRVISLFVAESIEICYKHKIMFFYHNL